MGHLSKFVRPGVRRIISSSTSDDLETTAFANADGRIAVVVLNRTEKEYPFLLWAGDKSAKVNSLPRSILTLLS